MTAFRFFVLLILSPIAVASDVYQTTDDFVAEAFNNKPPAISTIWVNKERKAVIEKILQHKAHFIRVRYWQQNKTSAWVLNEIGKEKPITVGIVIKDNTIQRLKVLAFRESRGWEVKHDFFTRQFEQAGLNIENTNHQLNKSIDGISGATLSVRALKKVARIALFLNARLKP